MDVSIIIVNYNTKSLLNNCLLSIYKLTKEIDFEVIVSDNGSIDGSVELLQDKFPQVILIENNANLGFGAANNKGLAVASGKYVFYLNSDTVLMNNAVKLFFDYFEENGKRQNLGVLGCNLLTKGGCIGVSYGSFCTSLHRLKVAFVDFLRIYKASFFRNKLINALDSKDFFTPYVGYVDYVIGADMFMLNNEYARFDESYFMYVEEVDLQYQLKKKGFKNYIIDTPKIMHLEGASSKNSEPKRVLDAYSSFSKLNNMISSIMYEKKNGNNPLCLFFLRLFTFLSMINPKMYPKSKEYVKKIFY